MRMTDEDRSMGNDRSAITAIVYENHSSDCRYKEIGDICTTLTTYLGTGGNNQPLVLEIYEGVEYVAESWCAGGMASIHD